MLCLWNDKSKCSKVHPFLLIFRIAEDIKALCPEIYASSCDVEFMADDKARRGSFEISAKGLEKSKVIWENGRTSSELERSDSPYPSNTELKQIMGKLR